MRTDMEKMQTTAKLRSLRMTPRKVRLLIDLIRGMKTQEAINQLNFSTKQAAKPVLKLLQSAIANAKHNHNMNEETLLIKTAFVDGGRTLHRSMPRAMGRATPIRKRTANITLVLEGEGGGKKEVVPKTEVKEVKAEEKKEEMKEESTKTKAKNKIKKSNK